MQRANFSLLTLLLLIAIAALGILLTQTSRGIANLQEKNLIDTDSDRHGFGLEMWLENEDNESPSNSIVE